MFAAKFFQWFNYSITYITGRGVFDESYYRRDLIRYLYMFALGFDLMDQAATGGA